MKVKLLLVDDHPLMLSGLRQRIAQVPHFTIVGEASTGELALELALKLRPDLLVMNIHLPAMNGIAATRQILSALPSTKVVIFSGDVTGTLVDEALRAGVGGYISKRDSVEDLIHAIDDVMAGKLCLSPEVNAIVVDGYQKNLVGNKAEPSSSVFSKREKQLLRLMTKGQRNTEIATALKLSVNTIETYRSRLMKKVGCRNMVELVCFAIREGIAVP